MNVKLNSLYLCVKDMSRAIGFYETFLETKVLEYDEVYSVFSIDGFRLGLFAYEKMKEHHEFGTNCLPSFSFASKQDLLQKLEHQTIVFPLTKIKEVWVAEIMDSEGNCIEVTARCENDYV